MFGHLANNSPLSILKPMIHNFYVSSFSPSNPQIYSLKEWSYCWFVNWICMPWQEFFLDWEQLMGLCAFFGGAVCVGLSIVWRMSCYYSIIHVPSFINGQCRVWSLNCLMPRFGHLTSPHFQDWVLVVPFWVSDSYSSYPWCIGFRTACKAGCSGFITWPQWVENYANSLKLYQ